MLARNKPGDAAGPIDPLELALVGALRSRQPAKAWNHLRELVCERVGMMRRAGETKAAVLLTLNGFVHQALSHEKKNGELEQIAEELIEEVSLWCIDEYDRAPKFAVSSREGEGVA